LKKNPKICKEKKRKAERNKLTTGSYSEEGGFPFPRDFQKKKGRRKGKYIRGGGGPWEGT